MYFIAYLSKASVPWTEHQLLDLLRKSRFKNEECGISGCLIFRFDASKGEGNFLQIIEGPYRSVDSAWLRISGDARHKDIIKLAEGKIEKRVFPGWSMGLKSMYGGNLSENKTFSNITDPKFWERFKVGDYGNGLFLLRSFCGFGPVNSDF